MKKKILSIILALTVAISMMPLSAAIVSAADVSSNSPFQEQYFTQALKVYTGTEPTFFHYADVGLPNPVILHQGADFKVVAADKKNASFPVGTYNVKIVGINGYAGHEVTTSITLDKFDVSQGYAYEYDLNSQDSFYAYPSFSGDVQYNKGKTVKLGTISMCVVGYYTKDGSSDDRYKKLKCGTDYTVKYTNCKKVGNKGTITITGKGSNFKGTSQKINLTILPATPKFSVKAGKKSMTIKFSKKASYYGAQYYQINYRVKGSKTWKYKMLKKGQSITIKKLKKGKKYEVFCYAGAVKKDKEGPEPDFLSAATKSQFVKIK